MRFGQNVLRMTWNNRFVQFSWKAHCFPVLERFWGQCDDFDNFDALKCDLAKTCSVRILTTLTLKNAIWPKRAAHDLKQSFCTIFMKSALFLRFGENWRAVWRFWQLWRSKMRFGQNVLRMTWNNRFVQFSWKAHCFPVFKRIWHKSNDFEKFDPKKYDLGKTSYAWPETSVLYNFHKKRTLFPFSRAFQATVTILKTLTPKNASWPKRAAHDLKRAFSTIFMKSALLSLFGENLRPVWRFWQLWRSKMRFGQNVLRMTWKERFVQFSWKAHCFPVLTSFSGQCDDFDNFDAHKCHLAKTCCAWRETSVLYNFHEKRTVFPFWREFEASETILTTLPLKNAIWPKRAAHDLKSAFCTILMESALFSRFEENLRPLWRFWQLWRSKMRFGQNVLRMTWKARFVKFSWKAHCFPVLTRISGQFDDFDNFWLSKMRFGQNVLRMTWNERFVQFSWNAHPFPVLERIWGAVWRFWQLWLLKMRFGQNVLRMTWNERFVQLSWKALKNAIWPKRAAHDLKWAFCTIFMKSALFSRFDELFRPVWRFWQLWRP